MSISKASVYDEFLFRVLVQLRVLAWNKAPHEQIADLADAVHNVPNRLHPRVEWREQHLIDAYLSGYDKKWPNTGFSLVEAFNDCRDHPSEV